MRSLYRSILLSLILILNFLFSVNAYSDNHNIYEILDLIKKDLKTLERAVYSGSIEIEGNSNNEKVSNLDNTIMLIVSSDLPFAMKRFCTSESLDNVIPVSMMRSRNFAKDYGVLLIDGPLSGITSRAVVTISPENKILHSELVSEIANEPDYQAALDSLEQ